MTLRGRDSIETLLNCRHPIVLAGMGGVARSDLVAAVTRAGGFGFLGMVREPPDVIHREVAKLRAAGINNFGLNIIPAATGRDLLEQQFATIVDLEVPAVALFWDVDAELVRRFRDAGISVTYQVGSPGEAQDAVQAGAQIIIAQGQEAGGHVRGRTPLRQLLPAVVEAVGVPVLAAGGLATGADLVTARALGSAGIVLGTLLMATSEAFAHPYHQQRLVDAEAGDTLLTDIFHINWPKGANVRVLRSAVTAGEFGDPWREDRQPIGDEEGRPIYLFSTDSPLRSMTGDFERMALYAGTGVSTITRIRPTASVIDDLLKEAAELLATPETLTLPDRASPVCFADEINPDYMGLMDEGAAAAETAVIVELLRTGLIATLAGLGEDADQPPFGVSGLLFARHATILQSFADPTTRNPSQGTTASTILLAVILQRVQHLMPRLAEGGRRRALAGLVRDIETTTA